MNHLAVTLVADDKDVLIISGNTYSCIGYGPWADVSLRNETLDVGIRSHDPAALRAIASRLFHEAAKLEAMQVADG